jgi:hypothetical protein
VLVICVALASVAWGGETPIPVEERPVRYVIGISPFLDDANKDEVYRRIVGFVLEDMPLRSSLWCYDAQGLHTIARIEIPDARAFRSAKTRANQFADGFGGIRRFLANAPVGANGDPAPRDQAIRFPQFMDFVGANLTGPDHLVRVVVLGSPLYRDDREPSFSMREDYFPSDGHLLATREGSLFGVRDRSEALRDVEVHFGWFGDPWVSGVHEEKIGRFWSLYLSEQGATLATFCGDPPTLFHALRSGGGTLVARNQRDEIDPAQTKLEMIRISRDVGVSDWITRELPVNHQSPPPMTSVGPLKIGIRWEGNIDLDLYARPGPEAETLFFEHTRSPEGYYFMDHRTSPDREYEFIEFGSAVDVREVEAGVNFYEGIAPEGPDGEIRIEFEGRIYVGQFSIKAGHGNRARSGPGQSEFWTRIDIPRILQLQPGR